MTAKEISQATSKPEQTVKNWIKKTSSKMDNVKSKMDKASQDKKPADYDLDETCAIIE
jgi:DNA-directed RNA polymerase specialized sigma24 family protein